MKLKITLVSDIQITSFWMEPVNGAPFLVENNIEFECEFDWHLLRLPYEGTKIEITDILINDESIEELLYTSYFQRDTGEIHQPSCAVWAEGNFKLWVHTNPGLYKAFVREQVTYGDYGKNLFEDYMLTVDEPVTFKHRYPASIEYHYNRSYGPHWWHKIDAFRPWCALDNDYFADIDREQLAAEIKELSKFFYYPVKTNTDWYIWALKRQSDVPLVPVSEIQQPMVRKLLERIGYTSVLDICLQAQEPRSFIDIHVDSHRKREGLPYLKACKKFYWALNHNEDMYFKYRKAGLLPMDQPLLINSDGHIHSVVNDSDDLKMVVVIYGDLPDEVATKFWQK